MANQQNYKTDIVSTSNNYTKFTVSRIVDNPLDSLIEVEVPTNIPDSFDVEVSLYSLYDNLLVYNTTVSSVSETFSAKTFTYSDTSYRRFLTFDFSQTDIIFVDGRFQAVFSFFVPVIGDANTTPLMVTNISPSRTEVQLQLMPEYRTFASSSVLKDFVSPQITYDWVLDAMIQIFNQPKSFTSDKIPTDNTSMSYAIVESFLPEDVVTLINDDNTDAQFTSSIKQTTQLILDKAYGFATESVKAAPDSTIYTLERLNTLISASIVYGNNAITPNQYGGRFSIV